MQDVNTGQGDLDHPIAERPAATAIPAPIITEPFGDSKTLMLAIQHAADSDLALRGLQIHHEDRDRLATLVEIAYVTRDELSDILGLTTNGRLHIGLKPEGVLDLPVEVAEVTGNIEETELLARYVEGKIAAIDKSITMGEAPRYSMQVSWEESYQHCALTLRALADEIRQGLHIPSIHLEGRVVYYNEDRSTGITHADALRRFFQDVNARNVKGRMVDEHRHRRAAEAERRRNVYPHGDGACRSLQGMGEQQ
jgi:hypothetical protein